ncbi:hypothetical protein PR202_ga21505 [Eleusine coracana subsp. coracana]|uniref:Uncharacterized protein n=1 Tax=Eleusine coracana subsp. coracana TaxID=191504 RepID=A0AAV5D070_ELECO|nr:hypothetical protein QOZ80_8AG0637380 [Eleusine coracana subsp. coracana]GJN03999.1 hypothetical protein PR202_ga21505 [Eleusine coracana subsp. coracana]
MVVLMEEFGGLSLKRKGADEPGLFDAAAGDDRSGFPLSCRATKMRRLACPDGRQDGPAASGAMEQVDLPMGDAVAAAPSPAAEEETKAMVLFGGGASDAAPRLRPCGAHLRDGVDLVVRAMLREADSRTVRELLAAAQGQGGDELALAVVPWVPPPSPAEKDAEPSAAEEVDDGAAAMDVEEEDGGQVHHWASRQTAFGGEGFVYRWPQHCMAPPQLPVFGQASLVMWSW